MVRVPDFRAAVNYAKALLLPPMRGDNLAIIARSGGHAVVAADGAEAAGLRLCQFPQRFLSRVQGLFRAKVIRPTNPLDLGDLFDFDLYAWITEECLRMEDVDAVLLVHTYGAKSEGAETRRLVEKVEELTRRYGKPVALALFSEREELIRLEQELDWPFFIGIEDALGALAAARDYHRRRERLRAAPAMIVSEPDRRIGEILARHDGAALPLDAALELIAAAGIPVAPWIKVAGPEEAAEAAEQLGYPLALKLISPQALHKSEVGGIALNIMDEEQLEREYHSMLARVRAQVPKAEIEGVLLQRMADHGQELILGGRRERAFGPAILLGLGGIYAELLEKTAVRVAPLTENDVEEMIAELRLDKLIEGFRGGPPLDREALIDAILKISHLLVVEPQISELDINPLLLSAEGVLALDARVLLS
jgi:acetyltransferase